MALPALNASFPLLQDGEWYLPLVNERISQTVQKPASLTPENLSPFLELIKEGRDLESSCPSANELEFVELPESWASKFARWLRNIHGSLSDAVSRRWGMCFAVRRYPELFDLGLAVLAWMAYEGEHHTIGDKPIWQGFGAVLDTGEVISRRRERAPPGYFLKPVPDEVIRTALHANPDIASHRFSNSTVVQSLTKVDPESKPLLIASRSSLPPTPPSSSRLSGLHRPRPPSPNVGEDEESVASVQILAGRSRKRARETSVESPVASPSAATSKLRPRKQKPHAEVSSDAAANAPKRRGRPPGSRNNKIIPSMTEPGTSSSRKRIGRPPVILTMTERHIRACDRCRDRNMQCGPTPGSRSTYCIKCHRTHQVCSGSIPTEHLMDNPDAVRKLTRFENSWRDASQTPSNAFKELRKAVEQADAQFVEYTKVRAQVANQVSALQKDLKILDSHTEAMYAWNEQMRAVLQARAVTRSMAVDEKDAGSGYHE